MLLLCFPVGARAAAFAANANCAAAAEMQEAE
jgi:hypothetical protein